MIEFYVFMKTRFNELSKVGRATQFDDGCIYLQLDVVPKNGDLMLSPVKPKEKEPTRCPVVPLHKVK